MNRKSLNLSKLILIFILFYFVLFPFLKIVSSITSEDLQKVVNSPMFISSLLNSIKTSAITTVISVTLGLSMALCLQRTGIRFKNFLSIAFVFPMLIPSISIGSGLVVLFGNRGIIRNIFGFRNTIYGFWGIVLGSVLYSYPVAFLMFNDTLKYEDASPYEAALVLGIPRLRRLTGITIPYLLKTIIAAVFSVFTMTVTDYGIPLMIGGKVTTLAVMMYQQVIGQLDFQKGSVIGLFLLIPAIIAFVFNVVSKRYVKVNFVTKPFEIKKNKKRDAIAYLFIAIVLMMVFGLIVSFVVYSFTLRYPRDMTLTLEHVRFLFSMGGGKYLLNSLFISFVVAFVGIAVIFITAYLTARIPSKLSQILHLFAMTSLAIPGIVLGLAYVLSFKTSFIYGTFAILILANLMHFFASPYLMMYNSLCKLNENLESVGFTLGIPRAYIIKDVIIPQSRTTILEVFSYYFVNSMMTISAVSFLFSYKTKPISMMIGQFEAQMNLECAMVVSILIMLVNVVMKLVIGMLKKRVLESEQVITCNER